MCTAINYQKTDHYFGRNLDLEYSFQEQIVITPRQYLFSLRNGKQFHTQYAMIGMATVINEYPLYAEAANEKGLAMAGLNFPQNAHYCPKDSTKDNITPFEFIPWILGQAGNVQEAKNLLVKLNLWNIPFSEHLPLAPLHYMISDKTTSIVVEPTKEGLMVYDNPFDVLTNNPPFSYHYWNMQNYLHLNPQNVENQFSDHYQLKNYAQGMGALGLPGDASSSSRFVRAAFHLANSYSDDTEIDNVTQVFHVLDSVAMVRGATVTESGKFDITTYSCCINTAKGIYYYKTYWDNRIRAISMGNVDLNASNLYVYEMITKQQIEFQN